MKKAQPKKRKPASKPEAAPIPFNDMLKRNWLAKQKRANNR